MPQVDFITYLLIIFWFIVILSIGYIFLNKNSILLKNNIQKKNIIFFEFFTNTVFYIKKNTHKFFSIEENNSLKF